MKPTLTICALALLALTGCVKSAESTSQTTNDHFQVEMLFENDGVKVYRFDDVGRYVYYVDARGNTQWSTGGKYPKKMSVSTSSP